MNNDIVLSSTAKIVDEINNATTKEDIKAILKQLDDIKTMLELANKFRKESIKYAQLEATALIIIASKGMAKQIGNSNNKRRLAAEWLITLSEEEQQTYIGMCAEGLLIEQVWWREVGHDEYVNNNIEDAKEWKEYVLEELKEKGIVDVSVAKEQIRKNVPYKDIAEDIIDGMRNDLRKAGGVGALYSNVYAIPGECNKTHLYAAIQTRIKSMFDDARSVAEICENANIKLTTNDLEKIGALNGNLAFYSKNYFLFVWLNSMGLIDEDVLKGLPIENDIYEENVELHYKHKRIDYMQKELEYLQPEKEWLEKQLDSHNYQRPNEVIL